MAETVEHYRQYTHLWKELKRVAGANSDYYAAVYQHVNKVNMYRYEVRTFTAIALTNSALFAITALSALNGFQKNAAGTINNACAISKTGNFDNASQVYKCDISIDANGNLYLVNPGNVTAFVNISFVHK